MLAPHFARLSSSYQGKLTFAKMDTDENVVPTRLGIQVCDQAGRVNASGSKN